MKKLSIPSMLLGFFIGTVGITAVFTIAFAVGGVTSADISESNVITKSTTLTPNNSLEYSDKDSESYIPVADTKTLKLNDSEHSDNLSELASIPNHEITANSIEITPSPNGITSSADITEHFTQDGIAKTTQNANTFTYEGVIGADNFQFGNPFPASSGEQLTFKLNSLEYVSSEAMEGDDNFLKVVFGSDNLTNNWTSFHFNPNFSNEIALSMPAPETANYHITIFNVSGEELRYNFKLTID